jgi:glycosyltransferase involved in cell wall biosynthesis
VRILILTQYYWPESFRINELARALQSRGCEITVLTGQPNYPDGRVFPGYRALSAGLERHPDGYDIYRVPLAPRGTASGVRLAANYLSFALTASTLGPWLLRGKKIDVVFVYEPSPITQLLPGIVMSRIKGARLVSWIQDLWPESLETTGHVTNPAALAAIGDGVSWLYRHHDLLLGTSSSFVAEIALRAGSVPVEYFPQPGEEAFAGAPTVPAVITLPRGFNIVFAGNLGSVQSLPTILDAAELLRDDPDVRFVLIGSGSRGEWLKEEISRRRISNVVLPGRFPQDAMPGIFAQASALLVSLTRSPIMSKTIPAKVQAYLAAGRPIIASLDGEGANIIREAGAGVSAPAEDAPALADAVRRLKTASSSDRQAMGEAGRRYYNEHFAVSRLAQRLHERLAALV